MYVLYEDSGNFKAEKIFSESDSTLQVESASGKRSKIKKNNVLFRFEQPSGAELLEQARELADTLEIDFLWECAPQEEFEAAEFAEEYFGHTPSAVEKAALIFSLNSAPAYFHRRGKGRYRPAPPDILKAALAAIEKSDNKQHSNKNGPTNWSPVSCPRISPKSPSHCLLVRTKTRWNGRLLTRP